MSTILDALRKVEDDRPQPADAGELDRRIAGGGSDAARPRTLRRVGLVILAVLGSAIAGAGVTLFGLSFLQEQLVPNADETTSAVASGEDASSAQPEDSATVVVAADVLAQRSAALERDAVPGTAQIARESEPQVTQFAPAGQAASATPRAPSGLPANRPPTPEAASGIAKVEAQPDPVAKLAAARRARFSQLPTGPRAPDAATPAARAATAVAAPQPAASPEPPPVARATTPAAPATPRASDSGAALREAAGDSEPLPVIVRGNLPQIAVQRTTWHPRRERRRAELSVIEDGRPHQLEVREGQLVGPLEVSEISPTGIILLHEGVELRRRVGAPAH